MKTLDDAKRAVELCEARDRLQGDLNVVKDANWFTVTCGLGNPPSTAAPGPRRVQLFLDGEHAALYAMMIRELERRIGEIDAELQALGIAHNG